MASTGQLDIDKLTPDNGAVRDLRELLHLDVLQSPAIEKTFTVYPGAVHGRKLAAVGEMGDVGEIMPGCKITWNSTKINTEEKTWDLGRFTVAEQICFDDFEDTLVRYALRKKTDVADLTGTDFIDIIVEPKLRNALLKMMFRLMWLGNKDAKTVSDGGDITDTKDPKFMQVCDGLFKRLFAITASNPNQRVTIDANAEATYALQRDKLRASGVATKILDDLVYNADMRIRQASDKIVLCTQSFADALAIDVKANNKGSELQWESLFHGLVYATEYNGETILSIPIWDTLIKEFEDKGTSVNKPHRVVYAPLSNLFGGVESNDLVALLKIWFSEDDQVTRMLVRDRIGTLILDDEMISFAY